MAEVRLADAFVPRLFARDVLLQSTAKSLLFQSNILSTPDVATQLASGPGKTIDLPFWEDLPDNNSNVSSDDPGVSSTPDKITSDTDVAVKHFRNRSWSAMDLVASQSQVDPMGVMASRVAAYWTRDMQRTLISTLTGIIGDNIANNASDMIVNIYNDVPTPTAANYYSVDTTILARATLGDRLDEFDSIAMHSAVYVRLLRDNLISFIPATENSAGIRIPTFQGLFVIVDDGMPATAGTDQIQYTTALFGSGAIAYAEGSPRVPAEIDRDPALGNGSGRETIYSRRHFVLHPRGIKFNNASVAGESPTNAELQNAANWTRVYSRKDVRIAFVLSNA